MCTLNGFQNHKVALILTQYSSVHNWPHPQMTDGVLGKQVSAAIENIFI